MLDINKGINKFRKDSLPSYVDYHADISNEFFKIRFFEDQNFRKKNISIISTVYIKIFYSDLGINESNKIKSKTTKKHQFYYVNSKSLSELLPSHIKKITINNLNMHKNFLNNFFNKRESLQLDVEYTNNDKKRYILFDSGLKLYFQKDFSNEFILNFSRNER